MVALIIITNNLLKNSITITKNGTTHTHAKIARHNKTFQTCSFSKNIYVFNVIHNPYKLLTQ